jgi:hypothetical protein
MLAKRGGVNRTNRFSKREIPVVIVILFGLLSVGFFIDRGNHATIDLEAITDQKIDCQLRLNWAKASNPKPLTIYPDITNYRFTVRRFYRHHNFTIDLDANQAAATLHLRKVVIHQPGSPPVRLVGQKLLTAMSNSEFVRLSLADDEEVVVHFAPTYTGGAVPQLNFTYPLPFSKAAWWAWVVSAASIFCIIALLGLDLTIRLARSLHSENRAAPRTFAVLVVIASSLILCLALGSAFNAHPDEIWHITSVSYFLFEPYPALKNTLQSIHTFSSYQNSYLATSELYYPAAALWTSLISTLTDLPIDQVQAVRLFSVTCFVLLVSVLVWQRNYGLLVPFLVTPQLWYIFAYANSDWFGVAATTLLLLFINFNKSTFDRFVLGGSYARLLRLVPVFILIGVIIFSKPNYWVAIIFCFYEPLVWILRAKSTTPSRIRALAYCLIILVVSALCITLKSSFSGATETRIAQTTESRPSLAPDQNRELQTRMASTRNLYEQHVSLWNLLTQRQWIWLSCRSFFGDFGWMSFHLTTYYYCIVIVVFGALLFCIVRATKMEANFPPICWFTVLVIGANISSAIAFSWLFDLQPQGRYLFPSLLALGWMLSRLQNWQNSRVIFSLILILAILGTYAFTCYAVIPLKEHVPSSFL